MGPSSDVGLHAAVLILAITCTTAESMRHDIETSRATASLLLWLGNGLSTRLGAPVLSFTGFRGWYIGAVVSEKGGGSPVIISGVS